MIRVGIGLYAGLGAKVNPGTGAYAQQSGDESGSVEPGFDIALSEGGHVNLVKGGFVKRGGGIMNKSGSISSSGIGMD